MRRMPAFALIVLLSATGLAQTENQAVYIGGSLPDVKQGDSGRLDMSQAKELVFTAPTRSVAIDYTKILRVEYRKEVLIHLGVAPAIAVGLLKARERRHIFTITFVDGAGVRQAALLEVPKDAAQPLLAVLAARSPQACLITSTYVPCPADAPVRRGPSRFHDSSTPASVSSVNSN